MVARSGSWTATHCRLPQAEGQREASVLEWTVLRRIGPGARREFQGRRGPLHCRKSGKSDRFAPLARQIKKDSMGLQEYREAQGSAGEIEIGALMPGFFGEPPAFERLLAVLREIEAEINGQIGG